MQKVIAKASHGNGDISPEDPEEIIIRQYIQLVRNKTDEWISGIPFALLQSSSDLIIEEL
jgi:hypothetical protein